MVISVNRDDELGYGNIANFGTNNRYVTDPMEPVLAPLRAAGVSTQGITAPTSVAPQISTYGQRPMARPESVTAAAAAAADPTQQGGWFKNTLFNENGGLNIDNITSILGSIGSIYGAIKTYGVMKDTLGLQKRQFETNLANQTKSYNTALEGRARSRAAYSGISDEETEAYLNKHRL